MKQTSVEFFLNTYTNCVTRKSTIRFQYKYGRISNLLFLLGQLIKLLFPNTLFVYGKGLRTGTGSIVLQQKVSFLQLLNLVKNNQFFNVLKLSSSNEDVYSTFREKLGFDDGCSLKFILSPNSVFIAFGVKNDKPVVVHFTHEKRAAERLQVQNLNLQSLYADPYLTKFSPLIPTSYSCIKNEKATLLTTQLMPGKALDTSILTTAKVNLALKKALKPLKLFFDTGQYNTRGGDHSFIKNKLSKLPEIFPQYSKELEDAHSLLISWQEIKLLPICFIHGDYWLANLLFDDDLNVSAIIDWDRCREDGVALFDALHLVVATVASVERKHFGEVLANIWEEEDNVIIKEFKKELYQDSQYPQSSFEYVATLLWLTYLWNAYLDGLPDDKQWLDKMIIKPYNAHQRFFKKDK